MAIYGAVTDSSVAYDDSIVAVMVYVYETVPPESFGLAVGTILPVG